MSDNALAVIILAAGKGTRMKSALPKVMHPVAGQPMIAHVLAAVAGLGAGRVIVVIGPGMPELAAAVGRAQTVIQERQLGTGHAAMAARDALAGHTGDVLLLFGDVPLVTTATLAGIVAERRRAPDTAIAVAGMRPADPAQYGRLVLGPDGTLDCIVEWRDASPEQRRIGLCNSGVMAVDAALLLPLLDEIGTDNDQREYYLTDIVGIARRRGLVCRAVEGPAEELAGVNARSELAAVEAAMQQRLRQAAMARGVSFVAPETVFLSADTRLEPDVTVGPYVVFGPGTTVATGARIEAFCHIEGARIGAGAAVGPFARLRPGAELGEGAKVGNFVEMKAARLGRGAKANHLTYLGDAEIGEGANIGAGTITCNYDGYGKYPTAIGAGAFIGSNTALVAPVTVGEGAIVGAGSVITEDVAADAVAVARADQSARPGAARRFRERRQGATRKKA